MNESVELGRLSAKGVRPLSPLAVLIGIGLSIATVWLGLRYFRLQHRNTLRSASFPAEWIRILKRNVPLYRRLPDKLRNQLHAHINIFLHEKEFEGCGGLTLTDEIRLTIAAQACFLLLNRETAYYPGLKTILVYPETYVAPGMHRDGPIETHGEDVRAGESWHRGPVVLSWGDIQRGTSYHGAAHNVVLHEFAHKLDEENEHADGLPVLTDPMQQKTWAEVLGREFRALQVAADQGEDSVLDHYGATSPAEFFAVATETFFEAPVALGEKHPLLYNELRKFFNVDPSRWHTVADGETAAENQLR